MAKNTRLIPGDLAPTNYRCVPVYIPDDPDYAAHFMGAMYVLGLVSSYSGDLDDKRIVSEIWRNIGFQVSQDLWRENACGDESVIDIPQTGDTVVFCGGDIIEESEQNDMTLQIQYHNGQAYLVEVCCGGAANWYALTPVSIGSDGDPVSEFDGGQFSGGFSSGGGASGSWDFTGVSSGNADCYAQAATAYLLGRAEQFAHLVIDGAAAVLDSTSQIDEYLEYARLVSDLLFGTGDLTEIQALTKEQVTSALSDIDTVASLESEWVWSGGVTRNNLRQWAGGAPNLSGGVPVRLILNQWIGFSLLIGLHRDLAVLASECESGNGVSSPVSVCDPLPGGADWCIEFDWITNNTPQGFIATQTGGGDGLGVTGWYNANGNHVVGIVRRQVDSGRSGTLLGMEVTLNEGMDGDRNVFDPHVNGAFGEDTVDTNAVVTVTFAGPEGYNDTDYIGFVCAEFFDGNGVADVLVEKMRIWGTGDVPFI